MTWKTSVLLVLFVLDACDDSEDQAAASDHNVSEKVSSSATKNVSPSAGVEPTATIKEGNIRPGVSEEEVSQLLDVWLDAQNRGDFAAYRKLYAEKFTGIKRSGARTSQYVRTSWLKDRKKMFAQPMKVTAKERTIRPGAASATVDFIQHWKSKTYEDEGPKRMVVVRQDGNLNIAREEMLHSIVRDRDGEQPQVHFIFAGMVVQPADGKESGEIQSFDGEASFNLRRKVTGAKDPFASVRTYTADGKSCDAKIGTRWATKQVSPHFGESQMWREDGLTDDQIDQAAWNLTSAVHTSELLSCKDALFALSSNAATPSFYAPHEPVGREREQALDVFREHAAYREIQQIFVSEGGAGTWAKQPEVQGFRSDESQWFVVRAGEGDGCGAFRGDLTALISLNNGKPEVIAVSRAGESVLAVMDMDQDKTPELVVDNGRSRMLWTVQDGKFKLLQAQEVVIDQDCPC